MELTFDGKVAVVTGSSRGIGFAVAREFARAGARVMLTSRSAEDLERSAVAIGALGGDVAWHAGDAGDPAHADACVAAAVERFGAVDVLINNAGANLTRGPLLELDPAQAAASVRLNQLPIISWTRAAWQASMRDRGGAVVNISAIGSTAVVRNAGWYSGNKAAMNQLTRQLAFELGPKVRVNAIAPGVVLTDMSRWKFEGQDNPLAAALPLGRIGDPEDIANAALFLASDAASWITGQVLAVDGGALAMPTPGV
jgi:NAD(P)-dependent dehydrogenase (short-subunit alcohol dehydrogenase family)